MTSIVLAGGKSLRLGHDKAFEIIGGQSLLQRVLGYLAPLSAEIIVVTARQQSPLPDCQNMRRVADFYPGRGSLGGIYSGLMKASCFRSLVVACDMPFLNVSLLSYMSSVSKGFDVVIPRVSGKTEPLHAIYSKECLAPIKELLERNILRIVAFFDSVKVRFIEEDEIARFDPEHLSFFNINTLADLEKAKALAEVKGRDD